MSHIVTLERVNELLDAMEAIAEYERGYETGLFIVRSKEEIEQSIRICIELCDLYDMYIVADQYRQRLRTFQSGALQVSLQNQSFLHIEKSEQEQPYE